MPLCIADSDGNRLAAVLSDRSIGPFQEFHNLPVHVGFHVDCLVDQLVNRPFCKKVIVRTLFVLSDPVDPVLGLFLHFIGIITGEIDRIAAVYEGQAMCRRLRVGDQVLRLALLEVLNLLVAVVGLALAVQVRRRFGTLDLRALSTLRG